MNTATETARIENLTAADLGVVGYQVKKCVNEEGVSGWSAKALDTRDQEHIAFSKVSYTAAVEAVVLKVFHSRHVSAL